ncbi:MAG: hypothetical protein M5U22_12280 [Thermoleophilia bacterium]|nr:hypothetical protein [Thermoleophilia bacterium]
MGTFASNFFVITIRRRRAMRPSSSAIATHPASGGVTACSISTPARPAGGVSISPLAVGLLEVRANRIRPEIVIIEEGMQGRPAP